jgi:hypothetical protein
MAGILGGSMYFSHHVLLRISSFLKKKKINGKRWVSGFVEERRKIVTLFMMVECTFSLTMVFFFNYMPKIPSRSFLRVSLYLYNNNNKKKKEKKVV